ncbi:MAG: aminoglycoside phosphotransferase family protein [Allosphingosinicella sp.]
MADDRQARIEAFLASHGWRWLDQRLLAADASFRIYRRLTHGNRRAVLMDAPPPNEDVRPFALLSDHLCGLGFSAPGVLAKDAAAGLLLLEDFGDDTYTRLLDRGVAPEPLYALATDVLVDLHRRRSDEVLPPHLPAYDAARYLDEACLLTDWYLPAVLGQPASDSVRAAYVAAWRDVLNGTHLQPRTLVLRDYHVDNLMRISNRPGLRACGLLDFQDAVAGPPAYDLASLLEDARRDIPGALKAAMLERYRGAFPDLDWPRFMAAFTVLAAQRHAKVIGIFTRLCVRDGKPAYLRHLPRVWRLLDSTLRAPGLAPVARWFAHHLPPEARRIPACRYAAE